MQSSSRPCPFVPVPHLFLRLVHRLSLLAPRHKFSRNVSRVLQRAVRREGCVRWLIKNYSSSPNRLRVNSQRGRRPNGLLTQRPEGERNNCFSKTQLVGQKYRDKTTLARKTRFSNRCFGFQSRRFSLPVGCKYSPVVAQPIRTQH